MTAPDRPAAGRAKDVEAHARRLWNADREQLRRECPAWEMPAWGRAHAWRRRPYLNAAIAGTEITEQGGRNGGD